MNISSLMKIHWYVLKLSPGNANTEMPRADNSVENWRKLFVSNPKPDLYNINAHTKCDENPLIFINDIIQQKWKYERITDR